MKEKPFAVRLASIADIAILARHRIAVFVDMGELVAGGDEARRVEEATVQFLGETMISGEWFAWIAEDSTGVLGSGSALLRRLPPRPAHADGGTEAYVLSFYTEPGARRRGIATEVMKACLAWCGEHGITRILLHASGAGRLVYAPLGFVPLDGAMVWKQSRA